MTNPQIIDYIRTQLRQGATKNSIVTSMSAGGWNPVDIEAAFMEASKDFQPIQKSGSFAPVVKKERHLIKKTIITIILLAIIFACVLFFLGDSDLPPL